MGMTRDEEMSVGSQDTSGDMDEALVISLYEEMYCLGNDSVVVLGEGRPVLSLAVEDASVGSEVQCDNEMEHEERDRSVGSRVQYVNDMRGEEGITLREYSGPCASMIHYIEIKGITLREGW